MVNLIDPSLVVEDAVYENALESVPKNTNRHRIPNNKITVEMLSPAARLLMDRYGYDSI